MVAITSMESLPDFCYDCPCHDGENGRCNADKEKRHYCFEYIPDWCPLKVLKEQEPQAVSSDQLCKTRPFQYDHEGYCPKCHHMILRMLNRHYCGFCGIC